MIMRRTAAIALMAAACCTTLACGGDDDGASSATTVEAPDDTGTASPTSEPTDDTAPTDDGGCAWLTADAASDAIGTPMTLVAGGPGGCFFATESGEGPALQISSIQIAIDVDQYVEESKALCEGDVVEVDAGDGGWACHSGVNPQGLVVFGRELVIVDVSDAASDAEGVELAATLAPALTPS